MEPVDIHTLHASLKDWVLRLHSTQVTTAAFHRVESHVAYRKFGQEKNREQVIMSTCNATEEDLSIVELTLSTNTGYTLNVPITVVNYAIKADEGIGEITIAHGDNVVKITQEGDISFSDPDQAKYVVDLLPEINGPLRKILEQGCETNAEEFACSVQNYEPRVKRSVSPENG